ncbi:hypothetical protein [Euzebya sp.]|uniref:hypothetical protein n=1 Tax=Euzebya sp. TaxID=1971409 RepID=UPI003515CFBC
MDEQADVAAEDPVQVLLRGVGGVLDVGDVVDGPAEQLEDVGGLAEKRRTAGEVMPAGAAGQFPASSVSS